MSHAATDRISHTTRGGGVPGPDRSNRPTGGEPREEVEIRIAYDVKLKRPGCVLLSSRTGWRP